MSKPPPRPDEYATHVAVLARVLQLSHGPVLELGAGWYSTPLIHWMSIGHGALTLENDPQAHAAFLRFSSTWHHVKLVDSWDAVEEIEEQHWGTVFIDHAPVGRRRVELERLRDRADYIVIHDSTIPIYGLESALAVFPNRIDMNQLWPPTSVVSMKRDVTELFNG